MDSKLGQRVLFVVDAASLLYAARDRYGSNPRIDFVKLLSNAKSLAPRDVSLFIPVIYLFELCSSRGGKKSLISYLKKFGYSVFLHKSLEPDNASDVMTGVISESVLSQIKSSYFSSVIIATNQAKLRPLMKEILDSGVSVHWLLFGSVPGGSEGAESLPLTTQHYLTSDIIFTEGNR